MIFYVSFIIFLDWDTDDVIIFLGWDTDDVNETKQPFHLSSLTVAYFYMQYFHYPATLSFEKWNAEKGKLG